MKRDIHSEITNRIVEVMESGKIPWIKEWDSSDSVAGLPYNLKTNNCYRGVNILLLFMEGFERGYSSNGWVTYKQAQELGGNVKRGEKGVQIIFYNSVTRERENDGDVEEVKIPFIKTYTVFNFEQCENIDIETIEPVSPPSGFDEINTLVSSTGAVIRHGGNQASFNPNLNLIRMPIPDDFVSPESYFSVLFHELTHWTGHKNRLNRDLTGRFGDESYAAEELIAEMGAAFLCAQFGICSEVRHAGYIQSWIKVLKNDKKAIFTAASAASKAVDYINNK